jgi:hypothetical protein
VDGDGDEPTVEHADWSELGRSGDIGRSVKDSRG